jgi:hypothetical protein
MTTRNNAKNELHGDYHRPQGVQHSAAAGTCDDHGLVTSRMGSGLSNGEPRDCQVNTMLAEIERSQIWSSAEQIPQRGKGLRNKPQWEWNNALFRRRNGRSTFSIIVERKWSSLVTYEMMNFDILEAVRPMYALHQSHSACDLMRLGIVRSRVPGMHGCLIGAEPDLGGLDPSRTTFLPPSSFYILCQFSQR